MYSSPWFIEDGPIASNGCCCCGSLLPKSLFSEFVDGLWLLLTPATDDLGELGFGEDCCSWWDRVLWLSLLSLVSLSSVLLLPPRIAGWPRALLNLRSFPGFRSDNSGMLSLPAAVGPPPADPADNGSAWSTSDLTSEGPLFPDEDTGILVSLPNVLLLLSCCCCCCCCCCG